MHHPLPPPPLPPLGPWRGLPPLFRHDEPQPPPQQSGPPNLDGCGCLVLLFLAALVVSLFAR